MHISPLTGKMEAGCLMFHVDRADLFISGVGAEPRGVINPPWMSGNPQTSCHLYLIVKSQKTGKSVKSTGKKIFNVVSPSDCCRRGRDPSPACGVINAYH